MSNYDIAIIGMGCVFPEANSTEEYWTNILSGDEYVRDMPERLWPMKQFWSAEKQDHKSVTIKGSFLKDFDFNPIEYGIPPKNLEGVDRAQLVAMEATRQALADAGIKPHSEELEKAVTVIGASGVDEFAHVSLYLNRLKFFRQFGPKLDEAGLTKAEQDQLFDEFSQSLKNRGHEFHPSVTAVGAIVSSLSNRVAQVFGIKGFNMCVDGACASSFVALNVASHALMAGDARIAIAGGVDLGINPAIYIGFSRLGGLSPTGKSNPFDNSANGLVIGEGGGVVVLKRLEDAQADGDRIQAVIRGTGCTSDGAGQAIYNPSAEQRTIALKKALKAADIKPSTIQYLEAHATSTVVGDANEYDAIEAAYGDRDPSDPLYLGTVKHQIGHLKAGAGMAGLIKTVLAMNAGRIPHMPRFRKLTESATRKSDALVVNTEILDWVPRENGSRYAAVTTSGFGGVNYHVILEQGPECKTRPRQMPSRDMAIVGMVNRLPGSDHPEEFWANSLAEKNNFREVDAAALGWQENVESGPENERIGTRRIGLIDDFELDYLRLKISPKSVSQTSPAQILSAEMADRLLTQCGYQIKDGKNIGVSIGSMHDDNYATISYPLTADEYAEAMRQTPLFARYAEQLEPGLQETAAAVVAAGPPHTEATLPGWMSNINAGIVANRLNCRGPNFTVDTACSSGLASLMPAMYQLMFTDLDAMVTGGLNRHTTNVFATAVDRLGAIAVETPRPFDRDGAGFIAGEGGVLFLLKRLEDARNAGDTIHGILRNVSGSSEYKSKSMVAPTEDALRFAIEEGLRNVSVNPEEIGVVDTHGSANRLSDIAEANAIAKVLRPNTGEAPPVHITAVKSHVGHVYGGSGSAGILSVLGALNGRQVPGIRNLQNLRPELRELSDRALPQKGSGPLEAEFISGGVTSLGLGGANYFAVLSAGDEGLKNAREGGGMKLSGTETVPGPASSGDQKPKESAEGVFMLQSGSLDEIQQAVKTRLETGSSPKQKSGNITLAVAYGNDEVLNSRLATTLKFMENRTNLGLLENQGVYLHDSGKTTTEKFAFCFPGQGTHYVGMGRHLYETRKEFREVIDTVHKLAKSDLGFDLIGDLYGDIDPDRAAVLLGGIDGAQISLFAVEVGLARVYKSLGVVPDVMVGHSFGEISALASQGVWSLEDAYRVVAARIRAAKEGGRGMKLKMLSIICDKDRRDALLSLAGDDVVLSNINAPGQYIFAGIEGTILKVADTAKTMGLESRVLEIGSAFHSRFMEDAVEPFRNALEKLPCRQPSVPIMSTITGDYISFGNSSELAAHLSLQLTTKLDMPTVINRLYDDGTRHFLEVGPKWAVTKLIGAILKDRDYTAVPSLHPKIGDQEAFRRALAYLNSLHRIGRTGSQETGPLVADTAFMDYLHRSEPAVVSLLKEAYRRFSGGQPNPEQNSVTGSSKVLRTESGISDRNQSHGRPSPEKSPESSLSTGQAAPAEPAPAPADLKSLVARSRAALAEATGYPEEMLGEELDLEADLGIDSVQRAEIWGKLVSEFGLDPEARPESIRSINELAAELARLSGTEGGSGTAAEAASGSGSAGSSSGVSPAQTAARTTAAEPSAADKATWISRSRAALAEATGYPEEMLGEELDLEADLGIDSVQRAEIWGKLVSEFGLDPEARPESIRSINELAAELARLSGTEGGSGTAAEAASGSGSAGSSSGVSPAQTAARTTAAEPSAADTATWISRSRAALAEATGYPEEMLGEELDLEADLGIDSVQRAEIWGKLVSEFGLDPEARPESIRSINELAAELARLSGTEGGSGTAAEAASGSGSTGSSSGVSPAQTAARTTAAEPSAADTATWISRSRSALAEATGYPEEMLGEELDLEADLGIDSVQRAEIWGKLVSEFGLDPEARPESIRSINELATELARLSGTEGGSGTAAEAASGSGSAGSSSGVSPAQTTARSTAAEPSAADTATWISRSRAALAEATGYPEEMLGEELDLEADLGIDSVQRAEIWGKLVSEFGLDPEARPESIRSINELAAELARLSGTEGGSASAEASSEQPESLSPPLGNTAEVNKLFYSSWLPVNEDEMEAFDCRNLLVIAADAKSRDSWTKILKTEGRGLRVLSATDLKEMDPQTVEDHVAEADTLLLLSHQKVYSSRSTGSKLSTLLIKETGALYRVFRKLTPALRKNPLRLICPISQDGTFGADQEEKKAQGAFPAGFIRTLSAEIPDCRFQLVDTGSVSWTDAADKMIGNSFAFLEAGLLDGEWVKPSLRTVSVSTVKTPPLEPGDLVLVTGGARGIVFECVHQLARETGCRLLLTGRTVPPDGDETWLTASDNEIDSVMRELEMSLVKNEGLNLGDAKRRSALCRSQWEVHRSLGRLKADGIEASYARCDVSDRDSLKDVIDSALETGSIRGIVHGAGVQKSKLFENLQDEAIQLTMKTKMVPLFLLAEILDFSELRFLSAFGSIAGLFGNAGQSDYALANDMLAAAVSVLGRDAGIFAQTVEWTAWKGTGMVTEAEAERFEQSGLFPVNVTDGVALYMQAVMSTRLSRVAVFNEGAAFAARRDLSTWSTAGTPRRVLKTGQDNLVDFHLDRDVYIRQHLVRHEPVVPGTFTTEIFSECLGDSKSVLKNISFRRPVRVREAELRLEVLKREERLILLPAERPELEGAALENLSFASSEIGKPRRTVKKDLPGFTETILTRLRQAAGEKTDSFYSRLDRSFSDSLVTGPVFRGVRSTLEQDGRFYSLLRLSDDALRMFALPGDFIINPVVADMAIQAGAAWGMLRHNVMAIPYAIGELRVFSQSRCREAVAVCREIEVGSEEARMDITVREPDGDIVFVMYDVVLKTISGDR